jgi:hypothetical protein
LYQFLKTVHKRINITSVFTDNDGEYTDITQSSVTYDTGISLEAFAADASVSLTGILVGDIDDSYSGLIA